MTAQTTDVYSGNVRPEDSDEIDLRRYLLVLLKWWREILLFSVLAGAITGITLIWLNNREMPAYTANADIVIARLMSNIELDDRVSTSIGTEQNENGWRTSLLQLASSSVVANAVLDELGDELPESFHSPEVLMAMIEATNPLSEDERYASNIIRINAETTDPEISAMIANSWARHLVDYVNGLYGEVPESMIESVTAERDQAFLEYQSAQKTYEEFVADNQVAVLTRQMHEKSLLRNEIMVNYTRMLTSVVSSEYNARLSLYAAWTNAPISHVRALISAQSKSNVKALESLYDLRASAIAQLNQARNMERSLVDGGEAAAKSNVTALQLLKLAAFASLLDNESLPTTLSITGSAQDVDMTLEEQLVDVRALVTVLEEYVAQLEDDIIQLTESKMFGADLTAVGGLESGADAPSETTGMTPNAEITEAYAQLLAPDGILNQAPVDINSVVNDSHEELLSTLESDMRVLEAAITAENAKSRELTHRRDSTWTTYETVGNKLQELSLLRSSANSEVRLGNPALVPVAPEPQDSPLLPVVAITIVVFFLTVVLALLVDTLGGEPFFARRTA